MDLSDPVWVQILMLCEMRICKPCPLRIPEPLRAEALDLCWQRHLPPGWAGPKDQKTTLLRVLLPTFGWRHVASKVAWKGGCLRLGCYVASKIRFVCRGFSGPSCLTMPHPLVLGPSDFADDLLFCPDSQMGLHFGDFGKRMDLSGRVV